MRLRPEVGVPPGALDIGVGIHRSTWTATSHPSGGGRVGGELVVHFRVFGGGELVADPAAGVDPNNSEYHTRNKTYPLQHARVDEVAVDEHSGDAVGEPGGERVAAGNDVNVGVKSVGGDDHKRPEHQKPNKKRPKCPVRPARHQGKHQEECADGGEHHSNVVLRDGKHQANADKDGAAQHELLAALGELHATLFDAALAHDGDGNPGEHGEERGGEAGGQ